MPDADSGNKMKQCPRCNRTYSDDMLNFCLEDGELLTGFVQEPVLNRYVEDSPPTMVLNEARRTNPVNWPSAASPPAPWQPQTMENRPFTTPAFAQSRNQTLPTIALILGILAVPMMCCYGGIWLGLPAAVFGFLGMRNADNDAGRYGGRGMAIGGMVLGVISFVASVIFAIITLFVN